MSDTPDLKDIERRLNATLAFHQRISAEFAKRGDVENAKQAAQAAANCVRSLAKAQA